MKKLHRKCGTVGHEGLLEPCRLGMFENYDSSFDSNYVSNIDSEPLLSYYFSRQARLSMVASNEKHGKLKTSKPFTLLSVHWPRLKKD